ncbi:MAG: hypothetical protein ACEQSX_00440 [Baekduiaceae bacterium]
MRRHAPLVSDPDHADEHASMMIKVRGVDASHTLHEHDAREYNRPGRRRIRSARDAVAEHLAGPHHKLEVPEGAFTDDLIDLHDEAHRGTL